MKALSLHQPWASLLAHGKKRVETRSWPLAHRGPLLVHAAKKWSADLAYQAGEPLYFRPALEAIGVTFSSDEAACRRGWNLPFGALVGRVTVVDCVPTEDVREGLTEAHVNAGDDRRYLDISMGERVFGDYSPRRFAFLCADFVPFERPIPFPGKQGLFEVPENLIPPEAR